jgi:hypothetical protein
LSGRSISIWSLSQPGLLRNLSEGMKTDVSEMSVSETLLAIDRKDKFGEGRWDWTPIPVFLSRGLFWADLYVNSSSGVDGLSDLRGKKIGVPDYCMTAALWFRITLKDLFAHHIHLASGELLEIQQERCVIQKTSPGLHLHREVQVALFVEVAARDGTEDPDVASTVLFGRIEYLRPFFLQKFS